MIKIRIVKEILGLILILVIVLMLNHSVMHERMKSPTTSIYTNRIVTSVQSTSEQPRRWRVGNRKKVAMKFKSRLETMRGACIAKPRPPVMEEVHENGKIVFKTIDGFRKRWKPTRQFLVDVPRQLLICAVPKAGSTSWHRLIWTVKRKRLSLSVDQRLYTNADTVKNEGEAVNLNEEDGNHLIASVDGDDDFLRRPLRNSSFRIILVRHPFARFISGWNQKLLLSIDYWQNLFKVFPKLIDYKRKVDANRAMSFVDFARFAAENQRDVRSKDAHFAPATKLCSPCEYDYTYVVKAESIDSDESWLMERLGLLDIRLGREGSPWNGSVVNGRFLKENIRRFMSELSPGVIKGLYELYEEDFEFFGYSFDFRTLDAGGFD